MPNAVNDCALHIFKLTIDVYNIHDAKPVNIMQFLSVNIEALQRHAANILRNKKNSPRSKQK